MATSKANGVIQWRKPGAKEAALALFRVGLLRNDAGVAMEAGAAVVALVAKILSAREGVPAETIAHEFVDHMLGQLQGQSEDVTIDELIQKLRER